jgi:hypothetical protein
MAARDKDAKHEGGAGREALAQRGERIMRVRSALRGDAVVPQRTIIRKDGWTLRRRTKFLDVLKATSNVTEAARAVRLSVTGAYDLRRRDKTFADQWMEALEQGYAELELALLRQALHGSEVTETLDDGKGEGPKRVKTVHSYPHAMGLRLLMSHRDSIAAFRAEQGIERPGSDAVREEIQRRIAGMRERRQDEEGGSGSDDA